MATITKYNFTDLQSARIALAVVKGSSCEDAIRYVMGESFDPDKHTVHELACKFAHKVQVLNARKPRTSGKSKAAIMNESLAGKFLGTVTSGDTFTVADVQSVLNGAGIGEVKTQKAVAVINVMIAAGSVTRSTEKGKVSYIVK